MKCSELLVALIKHVAEHGDTEVMFKACPGNHKKGRHQPSIAYTQLEGFDDYDFVVRTDIPGDRCKG